MYVYVCNMEGNSYEEQSQQKEMMKWVIFLLDYNNRPFSGFNIFWVFQVIKVCFCTKANRPTVQLNLWIIRQ